VMWLEFRRVLFRSAPINLGWILQSRRRSFIRGLKKQSERN